MKEIEITVKSVKGECSAGYKVGDRLRYCEPNLETPEGKPICIYAFSTMIPYLSAFGRQTDSEDWINSLEELQCADSLNTVVFALKRTDK